MPNLFSFAKVYRNKKHPVVSSAKPSGAMH